MVRNISAILGILLPLTTFAGPVERGVVVAPDGMGPYPLVRTPALVVLDDGAIICKTGGKRGRSDWDPADILTQLSRDGGKTWTQPSVVAHSEKTTINAYPVKGVGNAVHFIVMNDYGKLAYQVSTDGGATLSAPRDVTDVLAAWAKARGIQWTVVAPGPGSGIRTQAGRLLVPLWVATDPGRKHAPSFVTMMYSDDEGATWAIGDIIADNTNGPGRDGQGGELTNPNETDVIQLPSGKVMVTMRNVGSARRRLISWSDNGATGWSKPEYQPDLFEPVCEASCAVATLKDGRPMIVHVAPAGPVEAKDIPPPPKPAPRVRLAISASLDEGKTYPIRVILDEGRCAYSDTAIGKDGRILVAYEAGDPPKADGAAAAKPTNLTTGIKFVSIDPDWLAAQK